jgi:glycosyltransferase involved in cell wall biosynthesis
VHQHFGARSVRRLIKTASRAKLIVHLHGQIDERATVGNIPIAVWKADSVIAVSRSVALQVPQFNPIVVYNGVSTARAEAPTRRSPSKAVVVGTACRLVPLKGVSCLLRAMAELHAEFPNVQLDIAGRGPSLESLVHEAERLGLAKQVRFLGWQNNLRPILRNWDIFVLPSLDEGLPLAVLEAMAAGLPIVGTLVGGLPELIHHGCTGFLVPPNDPQSLAQQLRHLIVSPELRSSQGAAARQLAQRDFSSAKMVAQIRAVYDHLVTERNLRSKSKSESAMTQTYQV